MFSCRSSSTSSVSLASNSLGSKQAFSAALEANLWFSPPPRADFLLYCTYLHFVASLCSKRRLWERHGTRYLLHRSESSSSFYRVSATQPKVPSAGRSPFSWLIDSLFYFITASLCLLVRPSVFPCQLVSSHGRSPLSTHPIISRFFFFFFFLLWRHSGSGTAKWIRKHSNLGHELHSIS